MGLFDDIFGASFHKKAFDLGFGGDDEKKKRAVDLYGIGELLPELQDIQLGLGKRGRPLRDLVSEVSLTTDINQRLQPRLLDIERAGMEGEADILSDIYRDILGPLARRESQLGRAADIADVEALGPKLYSARRAADPLFAAYADTALQDLAAGSELTPDMRRELEQSVRAGQNARGMGLGPVDLYEEAITKSGFGQQLKQQRLGNVAQALGIYGDPFLAITGRPSQSLPFSQNAYGQVGSRVESSSPYNPYAGDVYSSNLNAWYSNLFSKRNKAAADKAATYGLIGDITGSVLGAGGGVAGAFCWLAREVFGPEDPRWQQFRAWMLTLASPTLVHWYLRHGPRAAELVRRSPELKPALAAWMESRIKELTYAV